MLECIDQQQGSEPVKQFANSLTVLVSAPHRIIEVSLEDMLMSHKYNVTQDAAQADIALVDLCYADAPYPKPPHRVPTLALIKGKNDNLADIVSKGYQGYLDYDTTPLILFKALQTVVDGGMWIERKIIRQLVDKPKDGKLTQRQREVQMLLIEGFTNRAIAQRLGISVSTVKSHVGAILAKTKVKNRLEFILKYKNQSS